MVDNTPLWIEINCTGELTGTKYFGRFEIKKYLTHGEKSEISRLFETYARGITEDVAQRGLLYVLAELNFHVLSTDAAWWTNKGLDLLDEQPILDLVAELRKHQAVKKDSKPA